MSAQTTYNTTMTAGIDGQLADDGDHDVWPVYNDEASAAIPFGRGVKWGTTDDYGVLLPSAETDDIIGMSLHTHMLGSNQLDSDGAVLAGESFSLLRKGRILVQCDSGCANGDRLWIRAVAGSGERLGAPENADDSTDTIDCTKVGMWVTTATAGGFAVLEVDFTNELD